MLAAAAAVIGVNGLIMHCKHAIKNVVSGRYAAEFAEFGMLQPIRSITVDACSTFLRGQNGVQAPEKVISRHRMSGSRQTVNKSVRNA